MMKSGLILLAVLVIVSFLFSEKVLAGGFNLKSIGQVDTSGRQISQWWYSGSQPIFSGEATSGGSVTISIDGVENTVTVDGSGNWTYSPSALSDGDHQVVLSSNGSEISFTLTTGVNNVNWDAVNSDSGTEVLPAAGIAWPGILLLITGVSGLLAGGRMIRVEKK